MSRASLQVYFELAKGFRIKAPENIEKLSTLVENFLKTFPVNGDQNE